MKVYTKDHILTKIMPGELHFVASPNESGIIGCESEAYQETVLEALQQVEEVVNRPGVLPVVLPVKKTDWQWLVSGASKPGKDVRQYLSNVFIDCKNRRMVATDGHRLHMLDGISELERLNAEEGWLFPVQVMAALAKLMTAKDSDVTFYHLEGNRYFACASGRMDKFVVFEASCGQQYPNIDRVLPSDADVQNAVKVRVSMQDVARTLRELKLTRKARKMLILDSSGSRLRVPHPIEAGETMDVPIGSHTSDLRVTVAYKAEYMQAATKGQPLPHVSIIDKRMCYTREGNRTALVMPYRI